MTKRRMTWIGAVVWGVFAVLPLIVDDWTVVQVSQYLTYGIFAMSLALIWGQGGLL